MNLKDKNCLIWDPRSEEWIASRIGVPHLAFLKLVQTKKFFDEHFDIYHMEVLGNQEGSEPFKAYIARPIEFKHEFDIIDLLSVSPEDREDFKQDFEDLKKEDDLWDHIKKQQTTAE